MPRLNFFCEAFSAVSGGQLLTRFEARRKCIDLGEEVNGSCRTIFCAAFSAVWGGKGFAWFDARGKFIDLGEEVNASGELFL